MCKAAGAVFGTEAVLEASRSEHSPTSSPPGPGHAWVGRTENGHGHSFPAVGKSVVSAKDDTSTKESTFMFLDSGQETGSLVAFLGPRISLLHSGGPCGTLRMFICGLTPGTATHKRNPGLG